MNDANGPNERGLEKLFGQLKSMAKQTVDSAKRKHKRMIHGNGGAPKLPRQCCEICNKLFDFAPSTVAVIPEISRCGECKQMLAQGLTALVQKPKLNGEWLYAFVKGGTFQPGEVVKDISEEVMQKVLACARTGVNGHNAPDIS